VGITLNRRQIVGLGSAILSFSTGYIEHHYAHSPQILMKEKEKKQEVIGIIKMVSQFFPVTTICYLNISSNM